MIDETFTVTVTTDGDTRTFENATIRTVDEAQARAKQIREDAPDREHLTDGRTQDIDAVIDALERAKAKGIDTVMVNDDGQPHATRPVITNNHVSHYGLAPEPETLHEWVEL